MNTDRSPLRVLLLEDSDDDAAILARHLGGAGYDVDICRVETGRAFEAALDRGSWQIVLSDYVVPGYSGIAALRAIRDRSLETPFIVVSGELGEENAVETMRAGADDYIMKTNLSRLCPAVVREIREASERRERRYELALWTEEIERSNHELEEFAYIASHDLSAPLRVTAGYIGLFLHRYGDGVGSDAKKLLEGACRGTVRMQHLIDDLLLYSCASHTTFEFDEVDTAALVDEVVEDFSVEIATTGAVVVPEPLPRIWSVYAPLSHVLHNLVGNALKFTNGAKPHIVVSAARSEHGWCFSVSDNGIGIESGDVEAAFRMFHRLQGADYPGTGMGLALAKRFVERFGGELWYEPGTAGGSVFSFTVPDREEG